MDDKEKEAPYGETDAVEPVGEAPVEPAEAGGPGEAESLRSRLAYLTAEFDNFRKRAAREREVQAAYSNEQLMRAILPFLDNLERAMGQSGTSAEAVLDGVRISYDTFLAELRKFGLEQVASEGEIFDPSLHEAIGAVPWGGKPEGTVLSESRKGYLLKGRLLRPAEVLVAAGPAGNGPDEPGN
ncbi:MAG: GrpE protein [Deltaproteobacteria bacterium]|nr:GrpE protein [Deltaproteobacteria bacterium]